MTLTDTDTGPGLRIGLDVGGSKTLAVLVDGSGRVVDSVRRPTGWGADAVVESILTAVRMLRTRHQVEGSGLAGVGVGLPGQVAPRTGRVVHAVNLGIESLDLPARLGLDVPVAVENDVKAAALGASALDGQHTSLAYLNLGTGVAAGIVVDGELWRGAGGAAGEVGHISIDPTGPLCRCGSRGCVETYTGGAAVAARWDVDAALPVLDLFDAADRGDARAIGMRSELAVAVAAAVRTLVLTVDPATVVIGGGLSALGARLLDPVRAVLAQGADSSPFLRSLRLPERVELLPAGSPAAALGAALLIPASAGSASAPR